MHSSDTRLLKTVDDYVAPYLGKFRQLLIGGVLDGSSRELPSTARGRPILTSEEAEMIADLRGRREPLPDGIEFMEPWLPCLRLMGFNLEARLERGDRTMGERLRDIVQGMGIDTVSLQTWRSSVPFLRRFLLRKFRAFIMHFASVPANGDEYRGDEYRRRFSESIEQ